MSEFKRPPGLDGARDDPEEQYRAGYQHGAKAALDALNSTKSKDELKGWVEVTLQKWRHDKAADPNPPS